MDLEQRLAAAKARRDAALKALAPKHRGGEWAEFRSAQADLLAIEREVAASKLDARRPHGHRGCMTRRRQAPINPLSDDADQLVDRAIAARFRVDPHSDQPSRVLSTVAHHDGVNYVELHNIHGLLARYRVCNNGRVRRAP